MAETDFPGIVIDPVAGTCIDEEPLLIVPVKTCECIKDCNQALTGNVVDVGKPIDKKSLPLISLNSDKTCKIAYWGQNRDTLLAADVVLVPAKFIDDPVVGLDGNGGFGPNGEELAGSDEELARITHAKYGHIAFRQAPFSGCRNIWCDLVYIDEALCLGVLPIKRIYEFFDTECQCFVDGVSHEVSDFVTDRCMDRLLPDDGFNGLPTGYPEAINFEYAAVPVLDQSAELFNSFFRFRRETPHCARPGMGYFVRVEITSLAGAITVVWADTLPAGHTLISGSLSGTLVFTSVGQTIVREYVVKTPAAGPPSMITGFAMVFGQPPTTLNLQSNPITLDEGCPTICFTGFGSQNTNIFGKVFWAGGGRVDPIIPPDIGLWVTVYAGQGSAGLSKREQVITLDTTVPALATSHTFQIADITGFAVGLPVWVFNRCFVNSPTRTVMCLDIEEQEALGDPNEEITGLYGEVTAINPALNQVTVRFFIPPNQSVRFFMIAKAEMMVAPDQSKGFYWEASPALVALICGDEDLAIDEPPPSGPSHCVIRWGYRFWNSTHDPCPGTLGAAFVCDGDGQSTVFELQGDVVKNIINPVDWIELWCSPIREIVIDADVDVGDDDIDVCDICVFNPCDVIQIVDSNCNGKEGDGPGYVGSVVYRGVDPCTPGPAVGTIGIDPKIPSVIPGCGTIDGFKTSRRARVFVKPDICRCQMVSPTTKCNPDGTPTDGPNFVCVDFENGTFTFDPSVVARNPEICFRAVQSTIQLDPTRPGIYFLRGIDQGGCKSPPSKPIKVVGAAPPPPSQTLFNQKTAVDDFSGAFGFAPGAFVPIPTTLIPFTVQGGAPQNITFEINLAQDNFSEIALFIDGGALIIPVSGMVFYTFVGCVGSFVTMVNGSYGKLLAPGPHIVQIAARGGTALPFTIGFACTVWARPVLPLVLTVKGNIT